MLLTSLRSHMSTKRIVVALMSDDGTYSQSLLVVFDIPRTHPVAPPYLLMPYWRPFHLLMYMEDRE